MNNRSFAQEENCFEIWNSGKHAVFSVNLKSVSLWKWNRKPLTTFSRKSLKKPPFLSNTKWDIKTNYIKQWFFFKLLTSLTSFYKGLLLSRDINRKSKCLSQLLHLLLYNIPDLPSTFFLSLSLCILKTRISDNSQSLFIQVPMTLK